MHQIFSKKTHIISNYAAILRFLNLGYCDALNHGKNMRNYNRLWIVWLLWITAILYFLSGRSDDFPNDVIVIINTIILLFLIRTLIFIRKKVYIITMFKSKQKPVSIPQDTSQNVTNEVKHSSELPSFSGKSCTTNSIKEKKDCFIASDTSFTGILKGGGNIIIEGQVEGDVICDNLVKIESGGHIKGEVRGQQVLINGKVEGKCYAARLSILPKGIMHGDIFSDEISIEKGGSFIGCSQLMEASSTKIKNTILKSERFIPDIQSKLILEDKSIK